MHAIGDLGVPRRRHRRWSRRAVPLTALTALGLAALPAPAPAEPSPAPAVAASRAAEQAVAGLRTPMFLLPLFRAAEHESGIPWTVLAAINEVETDSGRNLAVSPAGAVGWMQFTPATWRTFGVDADGDGRRDPWDRADAIFAAAAYLRAAGANEDLRRALFAYNHANWYVDDVLSRAQRLAAMPHDIVAAVTGLAAARPPVPSATRHRAVAGSDEATEIVAAPGAPVVSVAEARVVALERSSRGGAVVVLRDAAGNRYAYDGL